MQARAYTTTRIFVLIFSLPEFALRRLLFSRKCNRVQDLLSKVVYHRHPIFTRNLEAFPNAEPAQSQRCLLKAHRLPQSSSISGRWTTFDEAALNRSLHSALLSLSYNICVDQRNRNPYKYTNTFESIIGYLPNISSSCSINSCLAIFHHCLKNNRSECGFYI